MQFVSKLDRYWYEVYCDNQTGKVPISSCREWNATEMSSIKLVKNQHAAFVGKFDFMNACEPSDLPFATHDVIIGKLCALFSFFISFFSFPLRLHATK